MPQACGPTRSFFNDNAIPSSRRPSRHRLLALPGRPVPEPLSGRNGRGGDQGRAAKGRRRGSTPSLFHRRSKRLLSAAEHGQAGTVREPEGSAGPQADARTRANRRCIRRELSSGCAGETGPGLRGAGGAQSASGLLFAVRLRPHRSRCVAAGVRGDRRGEKRRHGDARRAGRAAAAVPDAHRRHVYRRPWRGGSLRGARRPRNDGQGLSH